MNADTTWVAFVAVLLFNYSSAIQQLDPKDVPAVHTIISDIWKCVDHISEKNSECSPVSYLDMFFFLDTNEIPFY